MNPSDILASVNAGEDKDCEFKSPKGGKVGEPMAHEKHLLMAYPDTSNHPKQSYQTNPERSEV